MGGLFGKPKMPELPKPVRMPDNEDKKIASENARNKFAQRRAKEGRASTELTGGDYNNNILGG